MDSYICIPIIVNTKTCNCNMSLIWLLKNLSIDTYSRVYNMFVIQIKHSTLQILITNSNDAYNAD
jgi:hypothetical protein